MFVLPLLLATTVAARSVEPPVEPPPPVKTTELRNPFWPVEKFNEYIKDTEAITSEPIVTLKVEEDVEEVKPAAKSAATAAAEVAARKAAVKAKTENARVISRQSWAKAAVTSLKITGVTTYTDKATDEKKTAYRINGRVYTFGDFISADCGGNRFTWRIHPGKSPKKPRFEQIRVVPVPATKEVSNEGKKK